MPGVCAPFGCCSAVRPPCLAYALAATRAVVAPVVRRRSGQPGKPPADCMQDPAAVGAVVRVFVAVGAMAAVNGMDLLGWTGFHASL